MTNDLPPTSPLAAEDLLPLIGSRICHDLISPLGAIRNGLELLEMAGLPAGLEIDLINASIAAANARIKFYRLAFGAGGDQRIGRPEIVSLLAEIGEGARQSYVWAGDKDVLRGDLKLGFLALQCLETAMPWGGRIELSHEGRRWTVTGDAPRFKIDTALWALLDHSTPAPGAADLQASQVQFGLLSLECRRQGRELSHDIAEGRITIRF